MNKTKSVGIEAYLKNIRELSLFEANRARRNFGLTDVVITDFSKDGLDAKDE